MKNEIKTIRESNTHGGVTLSTLSVRYPIITECEKINGFFCALAEKYSDFVKNTCFAEDTARFEEYRKDGGRRSKFPKREYVFSVSEVKSGREGYRTFKTEAFCTDGGRIKDYSLDYKTWRVPMENLCLMQELTSNRPNGRFDGFYLRDGESVFYKISPVWRERECSARHIPSFEIRLKCVGKRKKRKLFSKNV